MGMMRDGRWSSTRSKKSNSTLEALREKTLKLTPPSMTVEPIGELRPALSIALTAVR
jgi:hypothetical protein